MFARIKKKQHDEYLISSNVKQNYSKTNTSKINEVFVVVFELNNKDNENDIGEEEQTNYQEIKNKLDGNNLISFVFENLKNKFLSITTWLQDDKDERYSFKRSMPGTDIIDGPYEYLITKIEKYPSGHAIHIPSIDTKGIDGVKQMVSVQGEFISNKNGENVEIVKMFEMIPAIREINKESLKSAHEIIFDPFFETEVGDEKIDIDEKTSKLRTWKSKYKAETIEFDDCPMTTEIHSKIILDDNGEEKPFLGIERIKPNDSKKTLTDFKANYTEKERKKMMEIMKFLQEERMYEGNDEDVTSTALVKVNSNKVNEEDDSEITRLSLAALQIEKGLKTLRGINETETVFSKYVAYLKKELKESELVLENARRDKCGMIEKYIQPSFKEIARKLNVIEQYSKLGKIFDERNKFEMNDKEKKKADELMGYFVDNLIMRSGFIDMKEIHMHIHDCVTEMSLEDFKTEVNELYENLIEKKIYEDVKYLNIEAKPDDIYDLLEKQLKLMEEEEKKKKEKKKKKKKKKKRKREGKNKDTVADNSKNIQDNPKNLEKNESETKKRRTINEKKIEKDVEMKEQQKEKKGEEGELAIINQIISFDFINVSNHKFFPIKSKNKSNSGFIVDSAENNNPIEKKKKKPASVSDKMKHEISELVKNITGNEKNDITIVKIFIAKIAYFLFIVKMLEAYETWENNKSSNKNESKISFKSTILDGYIYRPYNSAEIDAFKKDPRLRTNTDGTEKMNVNYDDDEDNENYVPAKEDDDEDDKTYVPPKEVDDEDEDILSDDENDIDDLEDVPEKQIYYSFDEFKNNLFIEMNNKIEELLNYQYSEIQYVSKSATKKNLINPIIIRTLMEFFKIMNLYSKESEFRKPIIHEFNKKLGNARENIYELLKNGGDVNRLKKEEEEKRKIETDLWKLFGIDSDVLAIYNDAGLFFPSNIVNLKLASDNNMVELIPVLNILKTNMSPGNGCNYPSTAIKFFMLYKKFCQKIIKLNNTQEILDLFNGYILQNDGSKFDTLGYECKKIFDNYEMVPYKMKRNEEKTDVKQFKENNINYEELIKDEYIMKRIEGLNIWPRFVINTDDKFEKIIYMLAMLKRKFKPMKVKFSTRYTHEYENLEGYFNFQKIKFIKNPIMYSFSDFSAQHLIFSLYYLKIKMNDIKRIAGFEKIDLNNIEKHIMLGNHKIINKIDKKEIKDKMNDLKYCILNYKSFSEKIFKTMLNNPENKIPEKIELKDDFFTDKNGKDLKIFKENVIDNIKNQTKDLLLAHMHDMNVKKSGEFFVNIPKFKKKELLEKKNIKNPKKDEHPDIYDINEAMKELNPFDGKHPSMDIDYNFFMRYGNKIIESFILKDNENMFRSENLIMNKAIDLIKLNVALEELNENGNKTDAPVGMKPKRNTNLQKEKEKELEKIFNQKNYESSLKIFKQKILSLFADAETNEFDIYGLDSGFIEWIKINSFVLYMYKEKKKFTEKRNKKELGIKFDVVKESISDINKFTKQMIFLISFCILYSRIRSFLEFINEISLDNVRGVEKKEENSMLKKFNEEIFKKEQNIVNKISANEFIVAPHEIYDLDINTNGSEFFEKIFSTLNEIINKDILEGDKSKIKVFEAKMKDVTDMMKSNKINSLANIGTNDIEEGKGIQYQGTYLLSLSIIDMIKKFVEKMKEFSTNFIEMYGNGKLDEIMEQGIGFDNISLNQRNILMNSVNKFIEKTISLNKKQELFNPRQFCKLYDVFFYENIKNIQYLFFLDKQTIVSMKHDIKQINKNYGYIKDEMKKEGQTKKTTVTTKQNIKEINKKNPGENVKKEQKNKTKIFLNSSFDLEKKIFVDMVMAEITKVYFQTLENHIFNKRTEEENKELEEEDKYKEQYKEYFNRAKKNIKTLKVVIELINLKHALADHFDPDDVEN